MSNTMTSMGTLNAGWGICGFTSSFYAMYQNNPAARAMLVNATDVYSVLYEITDYLKVLQAAQSPLLQDITAFTQSFGPPYDKFTINNYIQTVDLASENTRQTLAYGSDKSRRIDEQMLKRDVLFGIALPPHAVVDYIERIWKWKAVVLTTNPPYADAIVGVKDISDNNLQMYKGLCHYLYRHGQQYYSWGAKFNSLQEASRNFIIAYSIIISKN